MFEPGEDLNTDMAAPPPSEQSNRTFIIAAGILAGIVFISIACMALYALVYLPQQKAAQANQQLTIEAQNVLIAQAMTQTMQAVVPLTRVAPSPTATQVLLPSATPVVALPSPTLLLMDPALTATMAAFSTSVAGVQRTTTGTPVAAMPSSGFADEVGLPGLVVMAVALIFVILLARRLRAAPVR